MRRVVLFTSTVAVLFCGWWTYKSLPAAAFTTGTERAFRIDFHAWSSGRCVIQSIDEKSPRRKVELAEGLFTHPLAVMPGPGGRSLICFSRLDASYAVFAIDVDSAPALGARKMPGKLADVVSYSDYPARACTMKEVEFTAAFIRASHLTDLSTYVYGGVRSEKQRADLGRFLRLATSPHDASDAELMQARPYILPEG